MDLNSWDDEDDFDDGSDFEPEPTEDDTEEGYHPVDDPHLQLHIEQTARIPETIQRRVIVLRDNLRQNTDRVRRLIKNFSGIKALLAIYGLENWVWNENPGVYPQDSAVLAFLKKLRHDLCVEVLARNFRKKGFYTVNMETCSDDVALACVREFNNSLAQGHLADAQRPDIFLRIPEPFFVEFTTGSVHEVEKKLKKYHFEENKKGLVIHLPIGKANVINMFNSLDSETFNKIAKVKDGMLAENFGVIVTTISETIIMENLQNVDSLVEEEFPTTVVTSAIRVAIDTLRIAMPPQEKAWIEENYWSEEQAEENTLEDVMKNAKYVYDHMELQVGSARGTPLEIVMNYNHLCDSLTFSEFYNDKFREIDPKNPPPISQETLVLDVDHTVTKEQIDNKSISKDNLTIYERLDDPGIQFFNIENAAGEEHRSLRAIDYLTRILDDVPPSSIIDQNALFIFEFIKTQKTGHVMLTDNDLLLKDLLDVGKKHKRTKGQKGLVFGQSSRQYDYPYHISLQEDFIRYYTDEPTEENIVVSEFFALRKVFEEESFRAPNMFLAKSCVDYVHNNISGKLLDHAIAQNKIVGHLCQDLKGSGFKTVTIIPMDAVLPEFYDKRRHSGLKTVFVDPKYPGKQILKSGDIPMYNVPETGRTIILRNKCCGVAILRTAMGEEVETKSFPFLFLYRRKKTPMDPYLNLSGQVVFEIDIPSTNEQIICVKLKRNAYHFCGMNHLPVIVATLAERVMRCFLQERTTIAATTDQSASDLESVNAAIESWLLNRNWLEGGRNWLLKSFLPLLQKGSASSRENESNNSLSAVQVPIYCATKPFGIGNEFIEQLKKPTLQYITRIELMESIRKYERLNIVKVVYYDKNADLPIAKALRDATKELKWKKIVEEDPQGILYPLLREFGINTENLKQDFATMVMANDVALASSDRDYKPMPGIPDRLPFLADDDSEEWKRYLVIPEPQHLTTGCIQVTYVDRETKKRVSKTTSGSKVQNNVTVIGSTVQEKKDRYNLEEDEYYD